MVRSWTLFVPEVVKSALVKVSIRLTFSGSVVNELHELPNEDLCSSLT
jgi:hypothetical protein